MNNTGSDVNISSDSLDPVLSHSDLEFTTVDEKPSDYVSALVRYESFRFEKNMSATARDILNESCSDYYSSILNVSSIENAASSGCSCDAVTDLLRARSFELCENNADSPVIYHELPESYEFDADPSNTCDICYSSLRDMSKSTCKTCKITSHTSCLLNSCNTITELSPVYGKEDLEAKEGGSVRQNNYEYLCKICAAKFGPYKKPRCCICNLRGGVLNLTEKLYYHPFCVYYSYDVLYPYFNNNLILSNVQMFRRLLNSLSEETRANYEERKCQICGDHTGVTIKCKYLTCKNHMHARCIMESCLDESMTSSSERKEDERESNNGSDLKHKTHKHKNGVLLFMMIKHTSNLGARNMLFKGSFCSVHTSKNYINYSIYKQLVNQSILTPADGTSYSKYRHVIDNILKQYFVKSSNINFKIDTSINIPTIVKADEPVKKRRKLDDILASLESKLNEKEDESNKIKEKGKPKEKADARMGLEEDLVTFETGETPLEKKADQQKLEGEHKDDKDKKEEEDLKVQKVLWQKFNIFNPITFNPFTPNYYRREGTGQSAGVGASANAKQTAKGMLTSIQDTHDDAPLLSVLLYNKEVKDSILPLNSILFDNIKSNRELSICYQQKILASCSGIVEYLNLLHRSLTCREDDDMQIFVLFENVVANYLLVYSINRKVLSSLNSDEFNTQMQYDLKALLTNTTVRDSAMKDNSLFTHVNVYGIKDDIKYIHSIMSSSGGGAGSISKSKQFTKKLKLSHKVKLNNFEMELLKRSILEIRNINYIKLIVVNNLTKVPTYRSNGGICAPPHAYMEEKYVNYIDWNKILHNIKNLYESNADSTPLKYDEYRLLSHFNTEFDREREKITGTVVDNQKSYMNNEYKFIEGELDQVNSDLIKIKNKLHEKILEYCSEHCLDQDKQMKDRAQLNKYEFNEYYYYMLYNMSKLFSVKNMMNLPNPDSVDIKSFKKSTQPMKKASTEHQVGEGVEEESRFCQVCYNEEENNINVLIKCARCLIVVHKYCYNVPIAKILRNTEYLCNRCEYEKKQLSSQYQSNYKKFSILCYICRRGSGPLTRAKDEWYHPFCYLVTLMTSSAKTYVENREANTEPATGHHTSEFHLRENTEEASPDTHDGDSSATYECNKDYETNNEMKLEENNYIQVEEKNELKPQDTVEHSRAKQEPVKTVDKMCIVCGIKEGVLVQCKLCATKFHPFCAYFQGFKFELVGGNSCIPSYTSTKIAISCNSHFRLRQVDGVKGVRVSNGVSSDGHHGQRGQHNKHLHHDKNGGSRRKAYAHGDGHGLKKGRHKEVVSKEPNKGKDATPEIDEQALGMEIITTVMSNRYRRYINRDVNDTIYDKDKKKRIIHTTPTALDEIAYEADPKQQTENTCSVCFRDSGEVCCTSCNAYVHLSCYPEEINNSFRCAQCTYSSQSTKDRKTTYCYICLNNDAMLIKMCDNMYYHVICKIVYNCLDSLGPATYYMPEKDKFELHTENKQAERNRTDIDKGSGAERAKKSKGYGESGCHICAGEHGLMVYCYKRKCSIKFHPNCAIKNKLVLEVYFTTEGMKCIAFCHEHSLLHNMVGAGLKNLLRLRLQLMMTKSIFKDMYDQNVVLKSMLRKRNEIYNLKYPLDKIYKS
ncbi:hypothetical protein MACJ_003049 [Theileria orientalis]|uniref:PHD-type domain-containing protein n=1 Tax=Theileria orientalis TaxID=68886 RepID=A0A976M7A5_THEOR|nr:hypothetical protein MACJ_003049 [Theileria orientalis]